MVTLRDESDGKSMSPTGYTTFRRFWVDDSGRQLPHQIVEANVDARRRAFKYLGLVEVVDVGRQIIIRWNVANVAFGAITKAAFLVAKCAKETTVTLDYFWGAWAREEGFCPADAIARITTIGSYRDVEPFLGTIVVGKDQQLVRGEGTLIRSAFESWDQKPTNNANKMFRDPFLLSKALSFGFDRSEDDILFRHVGERSNAAALFGIDWANTAVGRKCTRSQPDFEFDEQVCRVYEDALTDGEIHVDHIRAFIRRPDNDPVWVPYCRLLLRDRDEFGVPRLLVFSEFRQDIDIPFLAA